MNDFKVSSKNIDELLQKEKGKVLERLYEEEEKRNKKSVSIKYAIDYLEKEY